MENDLRKLRVRFQRALLGLLRTDDRGAEFSALEEVLGTLGHLAESADARTLWNRCEQWIESLRTSRERPKPGYIRFLRMVDQSLKVWLDIGQARFEAREVPKLLENLNSLSEETRFSFSEGPASTSGEDDSGPGNLVASREGEEVEDIGSLDGGDEETPEEIRSVLSGLAAHPAWDEGLWDAEVPGDGGSTEHSGRTEDIAVGSSQSRDSSTGEPRDRVPISNLVPRLDRIVLQSGRDLAKPVVLTLHQGGYLDRSLVKALLQPLEYIVRNAVYHGIESGAERAAKSKPRIGRIGVTLHRSEDNPRLEVETDGLSVDFDRLQRKGEEMGLLSPGTEATRSDLLACLTAEGFSTAHSATRIAGYGIGLDAARKGLEALGGRLEIADTASEGLLFVLRLPPGCCGPSELMPL